MRVVCSYCKTDLGTVEPLDDGRTSHGMCDVCFAHFNEQWEGQRLGQYLDQFSFPVMVVNGDRRVVAVNQPMADSIGKSERDLFGLMGGEAVECVNSRNPDGCGHTIHCHTCTIRLAVNDTWETGRPYQRVPASMRLEGGPVQFLVSTEKQEETVLVRLEEADADEPAH